MSYNKAQMGKDVVRINNPKNPEWMSYPPSKKFIRETAIIKSRY